jgi:hypothetical protein
MMLALSRQAAMVSHHARTNPAQKQRLTKWLFAHDRTLDGFPTRKTDHERRQDTIVRKVTFGLLADAAWGHEMRLSLDTSAIGQHKLGQLVEASGWPGLIW